MASNPIAIIPAYNPQRVLVDVVRQLAARHFQVVVVNDGSSSLESAEHFRAVRGCATVLAHDENRGKGEALKTGMAYVLEAYGSGCIMVTVDADGQHAADDVVRVCEEARRHPDALVLGSRSFEGDVPLKSRFGNGITRAVFRVASGVAVRDTQTGLRAFSGGLARMLIEVRGSRYEYETGVLMECARAKVPMREVGIRTIYIDGNSASHFNPVRDSFMIYREILKFSASSFASFLLDYALFCVLLGLTGAPAAANVAARAASATANYTLNRKVVFGSSAPLAKSLAQYAALAACVLACNTLALNGLVAAGANAYAAKVAVELALFFISYAVQHAFIFGRKEKGYGKAYLGNRV